MTETPPPSSRLFGSLRDFVRPRPPAERCELCSLLLAPQHRHLIEPANRRLLCSCDACAILFDGSQNNRYRLIPRQPQVLADFQIADEQWESLHLPINLAFFFRSSPVDKVIAIYPSPAGGTESLLTLEAWRDLEQANPILRELKPDVEALLVNRIETTREYYRAPIDECYRLIGLIRAHWRGLSGGTEVWREIRKFFQELYEKAGSPRV